MKVSYLLVVAVLVLLPSVSATTYFFDNGTGTPDAWTDVNSATHAYYDGFLHYEDDSSGILEFLRNNSISVNHSGYKVSLSARADLPIGGFSHRFFEFISGGVQSFIYLARGANNAKLQLKNDTSNINTNFVITTGELNNYTFILDNENRYYELYINDALYGNYTLPAASKDIDQILLGGAGTSVVGNYSYDYISVISWSSPPVMNESSINASSNIVGYCNATQPDGNNITYYYKWFVNGVVITSGNTSDVFEGVLTNVNNYTSTTQVGDEIILSCRALINDSNRYSQWMNSTPYNVQATLNITFYDQENGSLLNTTTITVDVIGDSLSLNGTTTTGNINFSINKSGNYTIRYSASGYEENFYIQELTNLNAGIVFNLDLTLLKNTSSTDVTITVYDELGDELEGAIVKVQKYDVTTNTYSTTEVLTTNFEGVAVANILLNTEYYKFIIQYGGVTVFTSRETYIYSTSIQFTVVTSSTGFTPIFEFTNIEGYAYKVDNMTYAFTYNDLDNLASQACFYSYRWSRNDRTLANASCLTTTAGTIYLGIDNQTGYYYELYGVVRKNSNNYTISSITVDLRSDLDTNGYGNFLFAILILLFMLIGAYRLSVGILLVAITPFFFGITGLSSFDMRIASGILLLGIITAVIVEKNRT